MTPKSKPQIKRQDVEGYLKRAGVDLAKEKMALLGIRGYYLDTMGKKGANDVGLYDDALIWVDLTDMASFNGNVDPSRYVKNIATLKVGVWRYKKGNHGSKAYGPYPAYRQAADVTVLRYVDGKMWKPDTGQFGINIHHGSKSTGGTSSLGCQTVPYEQWAAFKAYGDMLIARYELKDFCYVLADTTQGQAQPTKTEFKADWKNEEWTKILVREIADRGPNLLALNPSMQYWVMLFSALARLESGFDPKCKYVEKFKDAKGKNVVSSGLLQLSIESANAYGAKLKSADELFDPATNLRVGVMIANKLVGQDKVLCGGNAKSGWKAMARYWSQFRKVDKTEQIMSKVREATKI